jgi:hypothetical protein
LEETLQQVFTIKTKVVGDGRDRDRHTLTINSYKIIAEIDPVDLVVELPETCRATLELAPRARGWVAFIRVLPEPVRAKAGVAQS